MEDEEAVKNVIRKKEKESKDKSKKGEKKENSMGIHEVHNINDVDAKEHVRLSEKHEIAEMKRDRKKDRARKNKGIGVAEADIEEGTKQGEKTVACGEDGSGDAMGTVERKKKRKEKNKTSNAEEVEGNENEKTLDKENNSEVNSTKDSNEERKMRKVKRKREDGDIEKEGEKEVDQENQNCDAEMNERKKRKKEKKMNKHDEGDSSLLPQENLQDNVKGKTESTNPDENATKELERKKKKKNKMKDNVDNDSCGLNQTDEKESDDVGHAKIKKKKKKKKKHSQLLGNGPDDLQDEVSSEKKGKEKKTKSVENGSNDATPNKSNKKVRFSDQDEVFPIPDNSNMEEVKDGKGNMVRGKRFTPEEDEILKDAVLEYAERRGVGEDGLKMVLNCRKYPKFKGCWDEIARAIPYRPKVAVYSRAQIIFRRSDDRKWTQEEKDEVIRYQKEHGNEWKKLADILGKHRFHVKDTWRRIKLDLKKGKWTQEEYQKLFNLVNVDLQAKLNEEKISKHGMLRDNVCWTAISDELSTRRQADCCLKWYNQLTSRMVADGEWADTDDYRLIGALYSLDANCIEDVDWDSVVEERTGDVCRKRWSEMVLHIGKHRDKSFAEQVEVLAQRYCPNLLEARETWDSKPRVP